MNDAHDILTALHDGSLDELTTRILPYWMERTVDDERGGYIGRITGEDRIVRDAPKGVVLNARILWTFAAAARTLDDPEYLPYALRAYDYLRTQFADPEYGGVYWLVDHEGAPMDSKKQTYAQAFTIYGLAELYRAQPDSGVLDWAIALYRDLERYTVDTQRQGYLEAFSREWGPTGDVRLSEKDDDAPKSMNTHLHVLEGYTNLYRIWPDEGLRDRLHALLALFLDRILDAESAHVLCFFDVDWRSRSDEVSYGHDIEASWLLGEAAHVLGDPAMQQRVERAALAIARATLAEGVDDDGGLFNEGHAAGVTDTDKHWWPQAEAVIGFLNAYQLSGEQQFLDAAHASWRFIERWVVDEVGGEWHFRVSRDGVPYRDEDKVGPWKCPYHNARACLEVLTRTHELGVHDEAGVAVLHASA